MPDFILLDGSYGEGGGQILRTALTLSALTGQPFQIENIRSKRSSPGLRPQHLAAVRAMALLCHAQVDGDALGASSLSFTPKRSPSGGQYLFDISQLAGTGSAGAITLLFQTIFLPLVFAPHPSTIQLVGGTHLPQSPSYHYLEQVYLPTLERIGISAKIALERWGWYPKGGGQMRADIPGGMSEDKLQPFQLEERGKLRKLWGISAASNLPQHIIQRQRAQALKRLRSRRIKAEITPLAPPAFSPGTILFLVAQYEHSRAGFAGYGRLRYPAEKVADDAVDAFEEHLKSKAALDPYLADQILLPLSLIPQSSSYTTSRITQHLLTVRWVIQQFLPREILIEGTEGAPGKVHILELS